MIEQIKPMDIENSFEIITETLGDRKLDPENELVIKRVIHTSADFDYVENLTPNTPCKRALKLCGVAAILSPTPRWPGPASTRPF